MMGIERDRSIAEQALFLEEIAELSCVSAKDAAQALAAYGAHKEGRSELAYLRMAVVELIGQHMQAERNQSPTFTEFDVHSHFWNNLQTYIPGSKRITRKSDGENIPDGWVEVDGDVLPVELKRDIFTNACARQLRRYMVAYGTSKGVAVAATFTCKPDERFVCVQYEPSNITPVSAGISCSGID